MELDDFLRARLDEDESAARAATPGPWWHNPGKQWLNGEAFEQYDVAKGEEFVGYGGPSPFTGCVAATGPANHGQSMADAAHIARHNPARILADVDVKRQLLDLHQPAETEYVDGDICYACDDLRGVEPAYPCRTLRLLALPYADHADYRDEWRP